MPNRAAKPCAYPGCRELVQGVSRCAEHRRYQDEDEARQTHRLYDRRWQARRLHQLASHPWCEDCLGDGIYTQATDVHHVRRHFGDRATFMSSPLLSLCQRCHSRRTAAEMREGKGGKKVYKPEGVERGRQRREKNSPISAATGSHRLGNDEIDGGSRAAGDTGAAKAAGGGANDANAD